MTSPAIETIRREIGKSRDRLAFLHRDETNLKTRVDNLTTDLAIAKDALASTQSQLASEHKSLEALKSAEAVLAERMPAPTPVPRTGPTDRLAQKLEEAVAEMVAEAPEPATDSEPVTPEPVAPNPVVDQGTPEKRLHIEITGERHTFSHDPLTVHHRTPGERKRGLTRRPSKTIDQRARMVNLDRVSPTVLQRAELALEVISERAPITSYDLSTEMAELLGCERNTSAGIVSSVLPVLLKQGRIEQVGTAERGKTVWGLALQRTEEREEVTA